MFDITYKTNIVDIITVEEVVSLFDSIEKRYSFVLVSLSLYPAFNSLKNTFLNVASEQRNKELSTLLTAIFNRKQEINLLISKIFNDSFISINDTSDFEQIKYEKDEKIKAYKNMLVSLDAKEKTIMNGIYPKVLGIKSLPESWSLRQGLEYLKYQLNVISNNHDYCFKGELHNLVKFIDVINM